MFFPDTIPPTPPQIGKCRTFSHFAWWPVRCMNGWLWLQTYYTYEECFQMHPKPLWRVIDTFF